MCRQSSFYTYHNPFLICILLLSLYSVLKNYFCINASCSVFNFYVYACVYAPYVCFSCVCVLSYASCVCWGMGSMNHHWGPPTIYTDSGLGVIPRHSNPSWVGSGLSLYRRSWQHAADNMSLERRDRIGSGVQRVEDL